MFCIANTEEKSAIYNLGSVRPSTNRLTWSHLSYSPFDIMYICSPNRCLRTETIHKKISRKLLQQLNVRHIILFFSFVFIYQSQVISVNAFLLVYIYIFSIFWVGYLLVRLQKDMVYQKLHRWITKIINAGKQLKVERQTCLIDVVDWLNLKNKTSSIFYCNESLIAMDRK